MEKDHKEPGRYIEREAKPRLGYQQNTQHSRRPHFPAKVTTSKQFIKARLAQRMIRMPIDEAFLRTHAAITAFVRELLDWLVYIKIYDAQPSKCGIHLVAALSMMAGNI